MADIKYGSTNPTLDGALIELAGRYSLSRTFRAGERLFAEGEMASTMLLVIDGRVQVTKQGRHNTESTVIAERGAGDFLGEMALVDETERFATVTALTDCEVLEFSRANFERVCCEQPAFATRVLKSLSRRLRESDSVRLIELEENNRLLNASNLELQHLNAFLDQVIDQSPSAILIVTRTGDIFRMNRAATQAFQLPSVEPLNRISELLPEYDNWIPRVASGEKFHGRTIGIRGKTQFPAYVSISRLAGRESGSLHLVICQDISELEMLNQTIREVEKYESMKESAVETAHDLKNYLGVLVGNIELILSRLSPELIERCQRSIQTIERTQQEILTFLEQMMVGDRGGESESTDMVSLLRTVNQFCEAQQRFTHITFEFVSEATLPLIFINADAVRRVVVNLLVNAAEAIQGMESPVNGRITTKLQHDPAQKSLVITVADNGPGIPEELAAKVFHVKFTTKRGGHGIGLVSVMNTIQSLGGEIAVESKPGRGTSFVITLPTQEGKDA
jgi:signal transduction histidine kinase